MDKDIEELLAEYEDPKDLGLKDDWVHVLARDLQDLRDAIRKHRDERGHDRCWLDDQALYQSLPEASPGDLNLPPKAEFIQNCHAYWEHRQDPTKTYLKQAEVDVREPRQMREQPTAEELANMEQLKRDNEAFYKANPPYQGPDACGMCGGRRWYSVMDGIPCAPYSCFVCNGTGRKK